RQRAPEPEERLVRRGGFERDGAAPRSRAEPVDRVAHQGVGILLLLPAVQLGDDAVAPDPLDLEGWADDRRWARHRQEQGDQAFAPPGIVTGQVLVVGAGRRDEEVETAGLELVPGPLQAAGEDFRGKGRLLGRLRIGDCGLRIYRSGYRVRP